MRRGILKILIRPVERYLAEAVWSASSDPAYLLCNGIVRVRSKRARVRMAFRRRIMDWPDAPPKVWCFESWIRRDIDWHVYPDGGLCWCLDAEWKDLQGWRGKSRDAIATDGLRWLFKAVDLMLVRHLVGHYRKLVEWPDEWNAWAHGDTGVAQYEQQRISRTAAGVRMTAK